MLMDKKNSLLLVIDVQERLAPTVSETREVINNSKKLIEIAQILKIPYIYTEQYPKGLGETIFDIKSVANKEACSKIEFSCAKNSDILKSIKACKKQQIIITGVETHICVLQTAMDLKAKGFDVFVVSDATSSRENLEHVFALHRLAKNEIDVVTFEMVVFEWLEKAGTEEFKIISKKYIR